MSKEELKYLFSNSACLTPKQMKHYVRGQMANEESYAVELHLNSCPFCNEAIEGLFEQQEGNAAEAVTELNTNFLKDHFSLHNPQVHLNSMAPAQPVVHALPRRRRRLRAQAAWRPSGIAAILLLGIAVLWFTRSRQQYNDSRIVQNATGSAQVEDGAGNSVKTNPTGEQRVLASADLVEVKDEPVQLQNATAGGSQSPQQPQQPIIIADNSVKPEVRAKDTEGVKTGGKAAEETVVTAYKTPLVEKYTPSPSPRQAEEVEKMGSRNTGSVAATSAGAYQKSSDDVYSEKESAKREAVSADDLYSQKKYSAALNVYKQDMASAGSRGKRNYAAIQAARCHLALGNKQSAIKLLQSIVDEGGAQKRAAKRMLEDLGADKEE
jgi:hypothetical protein